MNSNTEQTSEMVILDNMGVKFDLGYDRSRYIWALKGISFSVNRGEIIGIIGKNGAGKSTLLRAISGIISPDEGNITIKTKCQLLSRGVGLRTELSGRDNMILGCLFLGHAITEIKQRLDDMIKFCEFDNPEDIDKPVMHYSSGMTSRLLFTIATAFTPDFLLLDELLSGGDISFKERAHKKMREIIRNSNGGIVATHDMSFVKDFCDKVVYLEKGKIKFLGNPIYGVNSYLKDQRVVKHNIPSDD